MILSNLLRRMAGCHSHVFQVFQTCQREKGEGPWDNLCISLHRVSSPEIWVLNLVSPLNHEQLWLGDHKGIHIRQSWGEGVTCPIRISVAHTCSGFIVNSTSFIWWRCPNLDTVIKVLLPIGSVTLDKLLQPSERHCTDCTVGL